MALRNLNRLVLPLPLALLVGGVALLAVLPRRRQRL